MSAEWRRAIGELGAEFGPGPRATLALKPKWQGTPPPILHLRTFNSFERHDLATNGPHHLRALVVQFRQASAPMPSLYSNSSSRQPSGASADHVASFPKLATLSERLAKAVAPGCGPGSWALPACCRPARCSSQMSEASHLNLWPTGGTFPLALATNPRPMQKPHDYNICLHDPSTHKLAMDPWHPGQTLRRWRRLGRLLRCRHGPRLVVEVVCETHVAFNQEFAILNPPP